MSNFIPKKSTVKRRDVGIAASVVVLSQLVSGLNSTKNTSESLEKFKEEFHKTVVEREQFFVRKVDMIPTNRKLDEVNEQLIRLTEQVASLKHAVKDNFAFSFVPQQENTRKVAFKL